MVGACTERRGKERKRLGRRPSAGPQTGLSFCHDWLNVPREAAYCLGKHTVQSSTHRSVCFHHTFPVFTSSLVALALLPIFIFRSYFNSLRKWHCLYFSPLLSFSYKCPFFCNSNPFNSKFSLILNQFELRGFHCSFIVSLNKRIKH